MKNKFIDDISVQLSQPKKARNLNEVMTEQQDSSKNIASCNYYMMSRETEKNLRVLQQEHPVASLVFSVIREYIHIGSNAVTISNNTLCKIINKSRATVTRAISHLAKNYYVQIIKIGNVNTYVVNASIPFIGNSSQRQAVFSSTVVAHQCEQEKGFNEVNKLKATPIIYSTHNI